jgi:hypothetical protein
MRVHDGLLARAILDPNDANSVVLKFDGVMLWVGFYSVFSKRCGCKECCCEKRNTNKNLLSHELVPLSFYWLFVVVFGLLSIVGQIETATAGDGIEERGSFVS